MKTSAVSIIMSTYNEKLEWVREAIESILNQTYQAFEFIIVLDNPNNRHLEILVREYEKQDARIKVIKNEENIGLAKSLNHALEYCTGDYIVRMDADDIAYINRLEHQLTYMQENKIDILGGALQLIDEDKNVITKKVSMPIHHEEIIKRFNVTNCLPHPTWMVRKEVYVALNGYRNIHTCEDYDLLLRARNKGYRFGNLNETVLNYRMTKNSISRKNALKQYYIMKYLQKNRNAIESIRNEDINEYVGPLNTNKKSERYIKANHLFTLGATKLEQKQYIAAMLNIIGALLSSVQFANKITRMVLCMKI